MKKPSSRFLNLVNERAARDQVPFDVAWARCRREHPNEYAEIVSAPIAPQGRAKNAPAAALVPRDAEKAFLQAVNELIDQTGKPYDEAYKICRIRFAVNQANAKMTIAKKAEATSDGRLLVGFPPPPDVLMELQLPANVSKEQFDMWRIAEEVQVTPEIAALLVRELCRHSQTTTGKKFQNVMDYLELQLPGYFAEAKKAQRLVANEQAPRKGTAAAAAAQESPSVQMLGPIVPTITKRP